MLWHIESMHLDGRGVAVTENIILLQGRPRERMAIVKWSDSLSVNIEELDQQHRQLMLIIEQLEKAMVQGKSHDYLNGILEELRKSLGVHFLAEERIFQLINYPEAESHAQEHTDFLQKVSSFIDESESKQLGVSIKVMNFLCDWAKNHLKYDDKKYAEFIAQQDYVPGP